MPKRTIYAIGIDLPDVEGFVCHSIDTDISLLDTDIIIFRPSLEAFERFVSKHYQGRPLLSEHSSFLIDEKMSHWNTQLKTALESGKTIIVFLPERKEMYRYTGEVRTSGTGRGQTRTNIVGPINNYQFIPWKLNNLVPGMGQAIKLTAKANILTGYWKAFASVSTYYVHFSTEARSLLVTKSGEKTVGAIGRKSGNLLLLPDLKWDDDKFSNSDGTAWTKAAVTFALSLRNEVLALDASVKSGAETTPEPAWAQASSYRLAVEDTMEKQISGLTARIEAATKQREALRLSLKENTSLRSLLYEKGPALEAAVREALGVLGFDAKAFKSGENEFDAVLAARGDA